MIKVSNESAGKWEFMKSRWRTIAISMRTLLKAFKFLNQQSVQDLRTKMAVTSFKIWLQDYWDALSRFIHINVITLWAITEKYEKLQERLGECNLAFKNCFNCMS